MNKQIFNLVKAISRLSSEDKKRLFSATEKEMSAILAELGLSFGDSSKLMKILKIIFFLLGCMLAGIGSVAAATTSPVLFV